MKDKELQEIYAYLPYRYASIIARETGFSKGYIYKVKSGERQNLHVQEMMLRLARKTRKKQQEIERIKKQII